MPTASEVFTPLEIQRIDAEERALDLITALLSQTKHKRGLTAREIADQTGLAVGYVNDLLKASKLVLRRRPHHPNHWYLNWDDLSSDDKPFCGRKWRPERKRGRPSTKPKVVAPVSETPRTDALLHKLKNRPTQPGSSNDGGWNADDVSEFLRHSRQLERELIQVLGSPSLRVSAEIAKARNEEIAKLRASVEELERGEFICKKCGLRKDDEHPKGEF